MSPTFFIMSTETTIDRSTAIKNLYTSIMSYPEAIYSIFKDFFGEERVDMQGFMSKEELEDTIPESDTVKDIVKDDYKADIIESYYKDIFILVHFPEVRVSNENDRYVDIKHLWAKVLILPDGTLNGKFSLNRSEYPSKHWLSGYMHSHAPGVSTGFLHVCTGKGPINNTIASLNLSYDYDIWQMFCLELSKFVETESLAGVPYRKLEHIGTNNMSPYTEHFHTESSIYLDNTHRVILIDFIQHLIKAKILRFNFVYGRISLAMSYTEYIVTISNEFISWYNKAFNEEKYNLKHSDLSYNIICLAKIDCFNIFLPRDTCSLFEQQGKLLFNFKGKEIKLNIIADDTIDENMCNIIIPNIANYIIYKILQCVNYRYGREENTGGTNTEIRYL